VSACSFGWEALRSDPLPWLLDPNRPNLHWRVLVELVGRPAASPAVLRARGGANAVEPLATLLADLNPDGSWNTDAPYWKDVDGPGWRLVAAVQWGADPADPRLHAASESLLASAPGDGGFAGTEGTAAEPALTARALQALAELGWCRHPRFEEGLAWLEEAAQVASEGGWAKIGRDQTAGDECAVTPVAILAALTACGPSRRRALRERARASLKRVLGRGSEGLACLGHPCLDRTDPAEVIWALARSETPWGPAMTAALEDLQRKQDGIARWLREEAIPSGHPVDDGDRDGGLSRWVTLKAVVAVMHFAVEAGLPRFYPEKP